MLHDRVMTRNARAVEAGRRHEMIDAATGEQVLDRRSSDRIPFPAEMVLVWNHNLGMPMRYRVIDAGDGGYRIHSSLPILEGTTGMVLRMLPSAGKPLDQPVMVAWIHNAEDGDGFDVGLRCF